MFVMASVIVLLVEAFVLILLLVGALLWLFFLRRPRYRCSGPDPTTRGRAEVRGFPGRFRNRSSRKPIPLVDVGPSADSPGCRIVVAAGPYAHYPLADSETVRNGS